MFRYTNTTDDMAAERVPTKEEYQPQAETHPQNIRHSVLEYVLGLERRSHRCQIQAAEIPHPNIRHSVYDSVLGSEHRCH